MELTRIHIRKEGHTHTHSQTHIYTLKVKRKRRVVPLQQQGKKQFGTFISGNAVFELDSIHRL